MRHPKAILVLALLIVGSMGSICFAQDPHERSAESLYLEALKKHTELVPRIYQEDIKGDVANEIQDAMGIYNEAIAKGEEKWAALAQFQIGRANEDLYLMGIYSDLKSSLDAFQVVIDSYGGQAELVREAEHKVKKLGVGVMIRKLAREIREWKDAQVSESFDPGVFPADIEAVKQQIRDLDKTAVFGLLHGPGTADEPFMGLGHPMPEIRQIVTELLQEVSDNSGVTDVIGALGSDRAEARAGAASALQKVFAELKKAQDLDDIAAQLKNSPVLKQNLPGADELKSQIQGRIDKLERKAKRIRNNLPTSVDAAKVKGQFQTLVADDRADVRLDAARAVGIIGLSDLGDVLIPLLDDQVANVRLEAVRAIGDLRVFSAVPKLMEMLGYDPDEHHANPDSYPGKTEDPTNDALVRRYVATALENIAKVPSVPALIDGLRDNAMDVRIASSDALYGVAGREFAFDPSKPAGSEDDAIAEIEAWWSGSYGTDILLDRFKNLEGNFADESPRHMMVKVEMELEMELLSPKNSAKALERVALYYADFQKQKDIIQNDIIEVSKTFERDPVVTRLFESIGGEYPLAPERKDNILRVFVAETLAKMADGELVSKALEMNNTDKDTNRRAGLAELFGRVPSNLYNDRCRTALKQSLSVRTDNDLRKQAAIAFGLQKDKQAATTLASGLRSDPEPEIQAYCAWAIGESREISGADPLGDAVTPKAGGETKDDHVRLWAIRALGKVANPRSVKYLITSRTDINKRVQIGAGEAIREITRAAGKDAVQELVVTAGTSKNALERRGALLLLGDLDKGQLTEEAYEQMYRSGADFDPPIALKDGDPRVREAAAYALISVGREDSRRWLVAMLNDSYVGTRRSAFEAIEAVSGDKSLIFDPEGPEAERILQVAQIAEKLAVPIGR